MHLSRKYLSSAHVLSGLALVALVGCGGTIEFQGKAPIAVVGNPPGPPRRRRRPPRRRSRSVSW
jgi:hypothetical protein